jgi:chromosome segregation ATPase
MNMHLEDVNIEGFKSFSEPTDMSFQPGIGVIIGNNGVGKSNILDAIVWTLGEDSLERIRCYERQELFFSGSKTYPPAPVANVKLVMKNGAEKNAPGMVLTRRMSRDGQNHFFIDDVPHCPDDYRQKLDDLKMTHALQTIIRQEEINDLLQCNPYHRFDMIRTLLGLQKPADLMTNLTESIGPLFIRYMSCLMPLSEVALEPIPASDNGRHGLDIEVILPGNRRRRAHQLSGGEKSITSLALKLAVFHQLETPFYLFDEVEPALDYINHKSMQAFLKDVASDKQLIMITHLRSTIDLADTLHGVRTRFDGSSFMKFYFVMDEQLLKMYKCC